MDRGASPARLVWNVWNLAHIARHGVTQDEVGEILQGTTVVRDTYGGRLIAIGLTETGRMLAVILEPEQNDTYYVVTARPASRNERRRDREASAQGG